MGARVGREGKSRVERTAAENRTVSGPQPNPEFEKKNEILLGILFFFQIQGAEKVSDLMEVGDGSR